jgi:hypothetical protein
LRYPGKKLKQKQYEYWKKVMEKIKQREEGCNDEKSNEGK